MSRTGLLALLLCGLTACASPPKPNPSYITLLANPDGTVGQVLVQGVRGEQRIDRAGYGMPLDGSQAPAPIDPARLQHDFSEAMAAKPQMPEHFMLYFETGSVQLTAESRATLPQILASAARRGSADMGVTGHTDRVGSNELNEGLGLRRAQAVVDVLLGQGLKVDAVTLTSQGKRAPLVATPNERPEPRNRRAEITIR